MAERMDKVVEDSEFYERLRQVMCKSVDEPAEPILVRLADVTPRPVRWLWPGWIPQGALSVLDGDPGLGKSTLTLDLAARVSRGWAMPPLSGPDLGRKPAGVLLLGAEDLLETTVRPRLDAAGADVTRVYSLEGVRQGDSDRPPLLPYDLELAANRIHEWGIKLIIVDPLLAFLGAEFDAHKDQDIRRCLRPLAKFAEQHDLVILLLRHLNKLNGGPALYRGGSSIGISGAARASLIVGRDPEVDRHVLAMNKCNLGPKPPSLAYRLESAGMGSRIVWEGAVELGPNDILGHGSGSRGRGRPDNESREVRTFLADLLAGGPVTVKEIQRRADAALHSWRTVERVKVELGVQSRREGGSWVWELPRVRRRPPLMVPGADRALFGNAEDDEVCDPTWENEGPYDEDPFPD